MTRRSPIKDWPERDRLLWERGIEPGGLFERSGVGASWSAASRQKTADGYNCWLSWLAAKELCDPNTSPADRVTRERVAVYIAELSAAVAPYTVLCRVQELCDALRVIASEWNREWLTQLYRTLRARVRPVREKLSRLKSIDELAALGERLMDEADAAPDRPAGRRAVAYRDGLIIALLAHRPVRLKNLAMMRLDRHLVKVSGCWQIVFAVGETKSRVAYEAILPSALAHRLERYLETYRPVLMGGGACRLPGAALINPHVWVSLEGRQLPIGTFWERISRRTTAEFGRSVSPHLFRDCAATSIAIDNPKHIGDASLVLGHAGHRMTEKHYNHARSLEASRRHAALISRLRVRP